MTLTSIVITLAIVFIIAGFNNILNGITNMLSTMEGAVTATILAIATIIAVLIFSTELNY